MSGTTIIHEFIPNLSLLLKCLYEFTLYIKTWGGREVKGASTCWEWKDRRKNKEFSHFRRIIESEESLKSSFLDFHMEHVHSS